MTADDFLAALASAVPETQTVVKEHFKDNDDELLLHLLSSDLLRFARREFGLGHRDVLNRLLEVIDRALRDGTEYVNNAMAVSFVEETPYWDKSMQPFIDVWPSGLRAEVERMRNWSPE